MIDTYNVGKQLQELRKARGWKQYQVAEKVNMSRASISNIESGRRSLTLATLKRFTELYQIDISYFGIDTRNFDEAIDLTTRLEKIFKSEAVDKESKEELYRQIMKIYLENTN